MWAARIAYHDLQRFLWLFDDKRPRKPYAGRKETRYNPNNHNEAIDLDHPERYDADGCRRVSFGRYHRFIRTTNGATIDIEISCQTKNLSNEDIIYLQCFRGGGHKHFHFVATPYKGSLPAHRFFMHRMPKAVVLSFKTPGYKAIEFKILKCDISTGSGRTVDSPKSIIWGDADRYRFDRVVEEIDGALVGTDYYRQEYLKTIMI